MTCPRHPVTRTINNPVINSIPVSENLHTLCMLLFLAEADVSQPGLGEALDHLIDPH